MLNKAVTLTDTVPHASPNRPGPKCSEVMAGLNENDADQGQFIFHKHI